MKNYINTVIQEDCIEVLKQFPDNSIDMIFADPPYKLEIPKTNGMAEIMKLKKFKRLEENWDEFDSLDAYVDFTSKWIKECKRVLKDTGSFWISGTYHNIGLINYVLQKLEIMILNEIVWFKRNAFPNLACRRFIASHETLIWCADKKKKYYFDYEYTKNYFDGKDMIKKENKQMRSVWDIPAKTDRKFKHPAQKSVDLLKRIILSSTRRNDVVLDPFAGSGTTAVVAQMYERKWIMIERNKESVKLIHDRLQEGSELFSVTS